MELLSRVDSEESMPVYFLGASLSFSSGSCEFSISDSLSLRSGLGKGICQLAGAGKLTTPPLLPYAFLVFSLEKRMSLTLSHFRKGFFDLTL